MAQIDGRLGVYKQPAISIFYGQPGEGKSLTAAEIQVLWREAGHPVVTNLEIRAMPYRLRKKQWGEYVYLSEDDFKVDANGKLKFINIIDEVAARNRGRHMLVVLDEIQEYFDPNDWKDNQKKIGTFFTQHRKVDASVIVISQTYKSVDVNIRRRAKEFRWHKNLAGAKGTRWVVTWFTDNLHQCICFAANSKGEPNFKEILGSRTIWLNKKNTAYYNTVQFHGKDAMSVGRLRRGASFGKRMTVLAGFLAVVYFMGGFAWSFVEAAIPDSKPVQVLQPLQPVKKNVPMAKLQSVTVVGNQIYMEVGEKDDIWFQFEPYTDDRFWQLHELIGKEIPALRPVRRPFMDVLRGKK